MLLFLCSMALSLYVAWIHSYAALTYSILYFWVIEITNYITSICLYALHPRPLLLQLLILTTQNNKSVKAPFTCDVWKIQNLRLCLVSNTILSYTSFCIFSLDPTPLTAFSIHHLQWYFNSDIARPRPTKACALLSTFQVLPSPAKQGLHDSIINLTRKKMHYSSCNSSILFT